MIKNMELTGSVKPVDIVGKATQYCWVINKSSSVVYASKNENIVPNADDVYDIPAGEKLCIENIFNGNTLYLLGSGKVSVDMRDSGENPYSSVNTSSVSTGSPIAGLSITSTAIDRMFDD